MISESVVEVEIALKHCARRAPSVIWLRVAGCEITGKAAAREEPDLDELISPFGGVHPSGIIVEASAEGKIGSIGDTAACVRCLSGIVDITVGGENFAFEGVGIGS